jgi:hypothetical protein
VREIEVRFRGEGCNQGFEQTILSYPLPQCAGVHHSSGRETLRRKLG